MTNDNIRVNKELVKKIDKLLTKVKVEHVDAAVKASALNFMGYIIRTKLSGQVLNRVTGALAGQWDMRKNETASNNNKIRYEIGPTVVYAAIHEFGGVIRRKNGVEARMKQRSYIRTSMQEQAQAINQYFYERMKNEFDKARV